MTTQAFDAPPADATGFAALLRERTQGVHREADRTGVIADLLRGRGTRADYALYLASLLPVYEAMERHLAQDDLAPIVRAVAAPGLARSAALRSDLDALRDSDAPLPPVPAESDAYVAAVEHAARTVGLLAHAYVRYLGDLSGGQILKTLLARTLGLEAHQLTFYDFPDIADIASCKAAMREALDRIAVGSADADIVIAESIAGFRHTIAVSLAVGTS